MKSAFRKLSHSIYQCKYHVVFCPKYRRRIFRGEIADFTGSQIRALLGQKDAIEVLELNVQVDHIHVVLSIPPKYAVSNVMGFLKGKLALRLFQRYERLGRRGRPVWSRGYCVSTVGLDEDQIRRYVQWQEQRDRRIDAQQLGLFDRS